MTFNLPHDKGAHILNKHSCLRFDDGLSLQCGSFNSNNNNNNNRKPLSVKKAGNLYLAVAMNKYRTPSSLHLFWSISVSEEKNTMAGRDMRMLRVQSNYRRRNREAATLR